MQIKMNDSIMITFLATVNFDFIINIKIKKSDRIINIARIPICGCEFFLITANCFRLGHVTDFEY